jgi:chromosome segregation ATPase
MSDGNGTTIGTEGKAPVIIASRQRRVEAGLMAVQEVEQERDECKREFEELETMHRGLQAEHDALQVAYARMQNDMTTYRQDRDEAVKRLAAFEAVYDAVLAVMQKHRGATLSDGAADGKLRD